MSCGSRSPIVAGIAGVVCGVVVGSELANRVAARRRFDATTADGERPAVLVVLGCRSSRSGRPHPLQRWRVDIAVRSMDPDITTLIFTGAAIDGRPCEADVMARYARERYGVPAGQILLERKATSTVQNIEYCVPMIESATAERGPIAIASDPVHAARARRLLRRQRPDLAARLVPIDDYRPFEHPLLKVATVVYHVLLVVHSHTRRPSRRRQRSVR